MARAGSALTAWTCFAAALTLTGCGSGTSTGRRAALPNHGARSPRGTVYLSSTQFEPRTVTVLDVGKQQVLVRHLRELSPGDPPYSIAVIGGRLVVYGRVATYAFGAEVREPGRRIGASWFFVPSASPGRVWLLSLDARDPAHAHGAGSVREVTVGGKVIAAYSARPPYAPVGAVDGGLLVQGRTLEIWGPGSGRILRELPGVFPLATRHSVVVSCESRCPVLHITNARSGHDVRIRPGPGFHFLESYDGAFSPDGENVAVPATTTAGATRVAVVNIARRTARLVPGAGLSRDHTLLAWASTGWLFYNAGDGRLAAYHPGAGGAIVLPLHLGPFQRIAAR
jgi:hypothetical protein